MARLSVGLSISLLLVLICGLAGCSESSSYSLAPVSGIVTLDGKPVSGATVTFQPRSSGGAAAGPGSTGRCDEGGRFELKTIRNEPGAVVAPHKVTIFPDRKSAVVPGKSADDAVEILAGQEIPAKYNFESVLTFKVPQEGTNSADFQLTSKP